MLKSNNFQNLGRAATSIQSSTYVALTDRWRTMNWFLNDGPVLAHIWDRVKWYNCPKYFITPNYPCHLEVEASAACQMKCPMCAQGKMFEKGIQMGNMDMDLFKKIVDEVHDKVYSIKLSWRGEPSLNPHLHEMIRYAKFDKNMKSVAFLTNLERYDEKMLDDLLTTGANFISVSFDGMKETYEKIRYPAIFEETVEKIKYLRRRRDELGLKRPLIRVQSIFSAIRNDPEEFLDFWEPIVDRVNYIVDQWRSSLDQDDYDLDPNYVCYTPWTRIAVGWNGTVALCKSDYNEGMVMGDLNIQSVHEVWHGKKFRAIRAAMREGTRLKYSKPCQTCSDGAKKTVGEEIEVHGRKITVKVNEGRKVDATKLDGKSNVWKKGARSKRNISRAAISD